MIPQQKQPPLRVEVGVARVSPYAKRLIRQTLDRNRLTYGPLTIQFENEFAKRHGSRYGLFTVSGTSALQVALHAMKALHGWRDGDEVLVPALTFIATSNVVLQLNLKPVFVDIDPKTYNIDPAKIERHITKRTRAIMPVHLFGQAAAMEKVMAVAKRRGLKVLVDSCETQLVRYREKPLGAWGDIVCFSTYTAHLLVTGVGGLMLTNDPAYATKMRSLMNHGRDTVYYNIDQDNNFSSKKALFSIVDRRFSFVDVGYSFRLTEMEAAIGVAGLRELAASIRKRQRHAAYLMRKLAPYAKWLQLPEIARGAEHAFMMFPMVIRPGAPFTREELITYLEWNGIETRYMMPLLSQPIYRKLFPGAEKRYPVASWVDRNGFYVGCHQYLRQSDLAFMVRTFGEFFREKGLR